MIFVLFYESVTDQRTDGPTDQRTDRRTDRPSYRDARTHLKTKGAEGTADHVTLLRLLPPVAI